MNHEKLAEEERAAAAKFRFRFARKMRTATISLCYVAVLVTAFCVTGRAFSLLGPFTPWMDAVGSYRTGGAIGGPMDIGEGYRWNVPVITYGFDQEFLDYFGSTGVQEIEKAISILNSLPAASNINVNDYPMLTTVRENYRAQQTKLIDLKSIALGVLLEQLGLADPQRYVFSLHDVWRANDQTNFVVTERSYDPDTWQSSGYINGQLYAYTNFYSEPPGFAISVPFTVDPLAFGGQANRPVTSSRLNWGEYWTGLTRDDVAGLRYLLSPKNVTVESLLPGTRSVGSNPAPLISTAPRPGVDKITFVRITFDAPSQTFVGMTNRFSDGYLTNGILVQQIIDRVMARPDIVFTARAFQRPGIPDLVERTGTTQWVNNGSLNGGGTDGPGMIQPPITITFNTGGYYSYTNSLPPNAGIGLPASDFFQWGSFDGSTNQPLVYPALSNPSTTSATDGCVPAPVGLLSWWPGHGSAVDIQSTNHGSLGGNVLFGAGKVGQGFSFDATNGWIEASIGFTNVDNWAMSAWAFWDGLNEAAGQQGQALIYLGYPDRNGFGLYIVESGWCQSFTNLCAHVGELTILYGGAGGGWFFPGTRLDQHSWNHLVLTRVGGHLQLYKNGNLIWTGPTSSPNPPAPEFYISSGPPFTFNGRIDEACFFSVGLADEEVASMFSSGDAGMCKTPQFTSVGYQPLKGVHFEAKGQTGKDISILVSTNLPLWHPFLRLENPTGIFQFSDLAPGQFAQKFYGLIPAN